MMDEKKKKPDKLARDAAAAKAARMSYGKWKAMQKPAKVEKKIPDGWQVCQYCGKPFKPKTKRKQKYCDVGCQKSALYERNKKKQERDRKRIAKTIGV